MHGVNPYFHFADQAEEAMNFYKSVFGGEFRIFQRYRDVPGGEKMPAEDQELIMHITLDIGKGILLMASDTPGAMGPKPEPGNNYHICIQAESEAEADRYFNGLSPKGRVEMPMNKTFWGAYFGMLADRFGIRWMINYTIQ